MVCYRFLPGIITPKNSQVFSPADNDNIVYYSGIDFSYPNGLLTGYKELVKPCKKFLSLHIA